MGRPRRVNCKNCERHIDECGELTARYLCLDCACDIVAENVRSLASHDGPAFQAWRAGVARSVGAELPEQRKPDA